MDAEPFVIAACMVNKEKNRQENKAADRNLPSPYDRCQKFRHEQPAGGSMLPWIIIGVIDILVFLLIRN